MEQLTKKKEPKKEKTNDTLHLGSLYGDKENKDIPDSSRVKDIGEKNKKLREAREQYLVKFKSKSNTYSVKNQKKLNANGELQRQAVRKQLGRDLERPQASTPREVRTLPELKKLQALEKQLKADMAKLRISKFKPIEGNKASSNENNEIIRPKPIRKSSTGPVTITPPSNNQPVALNVDDRPVEVSKNGGSQSEVNHGDRLKRTSNMSKSAVVRPKPAELPAYLKSARPPKVSRG